MLRNKYERTKSYQNAKYFTNFLKPVFGLVWTPSFLPHGQKLEIDILVFLLSVNNLRKYCIDVCQLLQFELGLNWFGFYLIGELSNSKVF